MPPKRTAATTSAQDGAAPKLARRRVPTGVKSDPHASLKVNADDFRPTGDIDAQMGGPSRELPLGSTRFPLDQLLGEDNLRESSSATLSGDSKPDLGGFRGYGALGEEELSWADVIKQGYLEKAKMGNAAHGKGKENYAPLGASVKTVEVGAEQHHPEAICH